MILEREKGKCGMTLGIAENIYTIQYDSSGTTTRIVSR